MNFIPLMLVMATFSWGAGTPPPCGQPYVTVSAKYSTQFAADANMETCEIRLWQQNQGNRRLCTTIYHEVGHLYGWAHTSSGLMSPSYRGIHPPCRRVSLKQPSLAN